jgi:hypothetical protein
MPKRSLRDVRAACSGARRAPLALCLLVAVAFVATLAVIRPWKDGAAETRVKVETAIVKQPTAIVRPAADLRHNHQEGNPAAQRAGPPDPEAQRTATAAAERAAQAAANLAATH